MLMPIFGFSYMEAGLLMTMFFTISGFGQAFAGVVVDRYGAHRVLLAGVGLLALSGIALSAANSYAALAVTAALAGVGNSVFHPADFSILNNKVSTQRLGYAFSVHGLAGTLGWATGAGIAGMSLTGWGWRSTGMLATAIAAISLILLFISKPLLDDAGPIAKVGKATRPGPTFGLLSAPELFVAFLFFFLTTAAFSGLQNFSTPVLGSLFGLAPAAAMAALTGYLLGSAGGTIFGGLVAARNQSHYRIVGLSLSAAALFAVLLATATVPAWSVIPLMIGTGFGVGLAGPSRDLLVRRVATDLVPAGKGSPAYGRIYGFVYSGLDVGLAVGPIVFGILLDAGGYHGVLPGVALLQLAAVATVMRMARSAKQKVE